MNDDRLRRVLLEVTGMMSRIVSLISDSYTVNTRRIAIVDLRSQLEALSRGLIVYFDEAAGDETEKQQ